LKKLVERLEADGIETIHDLLDETNKRDESMMMGTGSNNDPLTRIGIEFNEDDLNNMIIRSKWITKEYESKFKSIFEGPSATASKKRECIPLMFSGSGNLFEKDSTASILNQLIGLGEMTQIYGLPGTGKTYLCHHLAANLLIDDSLRSYSPEALYVDCEGGFDISIYQKIIENLLKNQSKLNKKSEFGGAKFESIKTKFFERLHYKRLLSHLELIELFQKLPELLKQKSSIKLIIFDSFTTHLRTITDQKTINKILNEYTMKLLEIAQKFNVAIIMTNVLLYLQNKKEVFGDAITPNVHNKIYLDKYKSNHFFVLEKSHLPSEGVIQEMIPIRMGEKGFEFILNP